MGSRTTAGSRRTAALTANSNEPGSSGTEVSVLVSTSGSPARPGQALPRSRLLGFDPACPPKGMDGHAPPLCERWGSGKSSGGLVRGGPLSRPLSCGVCAVTGPGRRGCLDGPRRRSAGLRQPPPRAAGGPHGPCRTGSGTCRRSGVRRRSSGPSSSRTSAGRSCCRSGGTSASSRLPAGR